MQPFPTARRSTSTSRAGPLAAAIVAIACFWLAYEYGYARGGAQPVAWRGLTAQLRHAEFPRPTNRLYRHRADLQRYLALVMPGRAPRLPPIDFRRREALLFATGPRSSSGYSIRIERVREERSRVVVTLRELTPSLGDPVTPGLTYPYGLLTLPRSGKPVVVEWQGRP